LTEDTVTAHAYHHNPATLPPLVQTWARVDGERIEGPDGPMIWHVLTDEELEALVANAGGDS
jgi:hypothetical protein